MEETPDLYGAYPRLDWEQIGLVAAYGERRPTRRGDVLFSEGDRDHDFFLILAGTVAILDKGEVIHVHGSRRFLGEVGLLAGQPTFLTARVTEPGEVIAVPPRRLRELAYREPWFGDLVLRAFLIRRSLLIEQGAGLRIIGSRFSPRSRRLRDFAARNRLPHRWIDVEDDEDAESLLRALGVPASQTPVVILNGERVLRNPEDDELPRLLGLPPPAPASSAYDLLIIGAGPAGLAAAVYGSSEGLDTMVVDAIATGGQAGTSSKIENYLGFPAGVSGPELTDRALIQAEKFGAKVHVPGDVTGLRPGNGRYTVDLGGGRELSGRTVLIATGARYRRLDVPHLDDFDGAGLYFAATQVEALQCRRVPVAIVGGGNSAGQAAMFLARHATRVLLFVRGAELGENMSRYLIDRIERCPEIEVFLRTEIREVHGHDHLEEVLAENNRTGEIRRVEVRALFVFIGADPCVDWLPSTVALDDKGYVLTGGPQALPLETSLPGVLAAGDVRSGSIKRVASAVGEGAMAVRLAFARLNR
ncbi:FAD-dependent oxidoreductase [Actinomadura syzygii]|uniref:Cyclic nucleotide-binding domain-containing protein n=1 Tax=Actinomadura syzygii TaxID=1427538 RepID=A0A5D0TPY8_9ACTN|nr:FAD-dependent oxidoreductase [Actinomadura syzygii]TYC07396.1 cyclic nucleotide-binding domain-containing protein [Actinomadura syzygii]